MRIVRRDPILSSPCGLSSRYDCGCMRPFLLIAWIALALSPAAVAQSRPETAPYLAVEVDRFVPAPGVAFPVDYRTTLVDDIAREISVEFPAVILLRQGDAEATGQRVLRVSGKITEFKPGNRVKRFLIGFGAGATVIKADVSLADYNDGYIFAARDIEGTTWTGAGGGDSQGAGETLARKVAKLCKAVRLLASN